MGGVRRWYDTVTAQIAGLTTSVADKMPVTGGSFTGSITAPTIHSTGTLSAGTDIGASGTLYGSSASISGSVATGAITASDAISASGTVSGGTLGTTGNLNVQGGATINGSVTTGYLEASSLNVPNVATVGEITCTGNISAAGWINCAQYRLFGVPVVMMTEDDVTSLEIQIADLLRRVSVLEGERSRALEPA